MMKTFWMTWLWLVAPVAWAEDPGDSVGYEVHYACVGLDGVPIANSSSLASQCCSGGALVSNPPPACRAGFGSIITSSGAGVSVSLNQAIQELAQVADFTGTTANYDNPQNVVPVADAQAMTASDGGAVSGGRGDPSGVTTGSGPESKNGSSGAGGAGGGGGGALAGGSLGTPGSTKRLKDKAEDEAVLEAGRYKSTAGNDGKKGKESSNPFDFFGRRDSAAGQKGGAGQGALRFGATGGAESGGNEAARSEDDRDYLSRINPGDSIFKVVSKRYVKETVRKNVADIEKLPSE